MKNNSLHKILAAHFIVASLAIVTMGINLSCSREVPEDAAPLDLTSSRLGRALPPVAPLPTSRVDAPLPLSPSPTRPTRVIDTPEVPNPQGLKLSDNEIETVKLINRSRINHSLNALIVEQKLMDTANHWASYFAALHQHNQLARGTTYAHNVCSPTIDAADAFHQWLASPNSQASSNIHDPIFKYIGVGSVFSDTGYWYVFFN